jgi:hypothetical protein
MAVTVAALLISCGRDRTTRREHDAQRARGDSGTGASHRKHIPLSVLPGHHAVCRLESREQVPAWAARSTGGLSSVTRTADELSIIVADSLAPRNARCERNWRVIKVRGPIPLNLIGVVAGLSGALADASVSLFALSTYDTDYIMVKQVDLSRATRALRRAGYAIPDSFP